MKRFLFMAVACLLCCLGARAYEGSMKTHDAIASGGYQFWIYTPGGYDGSQAQPVVIFLHGRSLCGHNLQAVLRYGTLDAIKRGMVMPAIVIAPQTPGSWNPRKVADLLDWVEANYNVDTTRVYVLGMSLGGYGTMDFCGTYPDRIAAGMALCGGTTLKDWQGLGQLPFWILHGTADRAVGIQQSKRVVNELLAQHHDERLRYDWMPGASHGALARIFYLPKTYEWLFAHRLTDAYRPVERDIPITTRDFPMAYKNLTRRHNTLVVK